MSPDWPRWIAQSLFEGELERGEICRKKNDAFVTARHRATPARARFHDVLQLGQYVPNGFMYCTDPVNACRSSDPRLSSLTSHEKAPLLETLVKLSGPHALAMASVNFANIQPSARQCRFYSVMVRGVVQRGLVMERVHPRRPMDRSFLGFKHFLLRILNGPEAPRPAVQPARRDRPEHQADERHDWSRIEL